MAEAETGKKKKETISPTKLIAGALASVTVAYLGSRLGIAGTISGAGIASAITAVASNLYQRSLDRTSNSVKAKLTAARTLREPQPGPENGTAAAPGNGTARTAEPTSPLTRPVQPMRSQPPVRSTAPLTQQPGTRLRTGLQPVQRDPAADAPTRRITPVGQQATQFMGPATSGTLGVPAAPTQPPADPKRRLNWKVAIAVAVGVFAISMGAITGIELLSGAPLSGGTSGTTFGHVFANQPTNETRTHQAPASTTITPAPTTTTPDNPSTTTPAETTTPNPNEGPPAGTGAPTTTTPPSRSTTTHPATTTTQQPPA